MNRWVGLCLVIGMVGCSTAPKKGQISVASYAKPAYSCTMHPDVVTNDPKGVCMVCNMTTDTQVKAPPGKTHNVAVIPGGQGKARLHMVLPSRSQQEVPLVDRGDYYALDLVLPGAGEYRFQARGEKRMLADAALNL